MKFLCVILAMLVASVFALPPKWHQLTPSYSYDAYLKDFSKRYTNQTELNIRREIFTTNLKDILMHNKDETQSYKKGVNHLTDWTSEELKAIRGGRYEPKFQSKYRREHQKKAGGKAAPTSLDWRTVQPAVVTAVKDQGRCGDCWAHAVTETIESAWAMKTGDLFDLSQQQITSCTPKMGSCYSCDGSFPALAYEYAASHGITEEWIYSFASYKGEMPTCIEDPYVQTIIRTIVNISGYGEVAENNQEDTIDALVNNGPLGILVDASSWSPYESGIFDGCHYARNISLDHAVMVVGYGTEGSKDYWIVRNSWAPSWGEHGYIRLLKTPKAECGWNVGAGHPIGCFGQGPSAWWSCGMCGILFNPTYATVDP